MTTGRWATLALALALAMSASLVSGPSQAAMAVIDVRAIAQMAQQLSVLRNQLSALRDQLQQAREAQAAFSGNRALDGIGLTAREYLPPDYQELERALLGTSSAYAGLAQEIELLAREAGVLTPAQLGHLGADHRSDVEGLRRETALQQRHRSSLTSGLGSGDG